MKKYLVGSIMPVLLTVGLTPQDATVPILKAVLTHIKVERLRDQWGVLHVDPRILPPDASGPVLQSATRHSSAVLAGVSVAGLASPMTTERAEECVASPDKESCKGSGRFASVSLGQPTVKGDSATVTIMVTRARTLTAADSARANTNRNPANPEFWLRRMAAPIGEILELRLTRTAGTWSVASVKFLGGS